MFELGVTVVLAPFVCLGEFIFGGGSNCLDDTENFAHDVDVIARIDEVLPDGIGRLESDTYTGLWHFLNVGHTGEFNRVPGMSYLDGGLDGQIDALDIALVVTTDLAGLTLDPDRSSGPSRYGQFADGAKNRRKADYWSTGIGHVEFEPLDNLAQFGWNRFATGKGASGLGWVLHALGDALQPHHTIAASGWGHRVYEEFAGQVWAEVFHEHKPEHYFDFAAALEHAYHWWRFIDDRTAGNNATPVPVKAFIEAVAGETRDLPSALPIFIPLISVPFAVNSHSDYPQRFYGDKKPQFFDLGHPIDGGHDRVPHQGGGVPATGCGHGAERPLLVPDGTGAGQRRFERPRAAQRRLPRLRDRDLRGDVAVARRPVRGGLPGRQADRRQRHHLRQQLSDRRQLHRRELPAGAAICRGRHLRGALRAG